MKFMSIKYAMIYLFMFFFSNFLVGCGQKQIIFYDGYHERNEMYEAPFQTKYMESENLTIHIKSNIYEKEKADSIVQMIQKDYEKIEKKAKELCTKVTIYIVEETISGEAQRSGNEIFCTLADIESKKYRELLTAACLEIRNYWLAIGISDFCFDEELVLKEEMDEIKLYISNQKNKGFFSLLPVYFSEEFVSEKDINMARLVSKAFTQYMISDIGIKKLVEKEKLKQSFVDYRQLWLQSIGVEIEIDSIIETMDLMDFIFEKKYPVILSHNNIVFYFAPVDWITNAEEVYRFLKETIEGYEYLKVSIMETESEAYQKIKENLNNTMHIYLSDAGEISHVSSDQKIVIGRRGDRFHEMMHVVLPVLDWDEHWYYEGIVTILTSELDALYNNGEEEMIFEGLTKGDAYEQMSPDNQLFMNITAENYSLYASLPQAQEELNYLIFDYAMGTTTLLNSEIQTDFNIAKRTIENRYYGKIEKGIKVINYGNQLTYPEACVYIKYLIDEYSLATVLDVALGGIDFEEAFNGSFSVVLDKVIASLLEIQETGYKSQ